MIATIHGLRHRIEHDVWPVPGGNGRATSDVVVIMIHRGDRLGDRLSWARAAMRQIQPPSKPLTMLAVSRRIRAPCGHPNQGRHQGGTTNDGTRRRIDDMQKDKTIEPVRVEPQPPFGYGGIFELWRGLDAWHPDAFKSKTDPRLQQAEAAARKVHPFADQPRQGTWDLCDFCGNVVGQVLDGPETPAGLPVDGSRRRALWSAKRQQWEWCDDLKNPDTWMPWNAAGEPPMEAKKDEE